MNYRYNRRPPKRRITGRFYAFLTVVLMLVVALCVFINVRSNPPLKTYNNPVYDPQAATVVTAPPVSEAPVVLSDPATGGTVRAETPTEPQDIAAEDTSAETAGDEAAALSVEDDIELEPLPAEDFTFVENVQARTDLPAEWTNILLLGSDSRNMDKITKTRCDTIMIVSINGSTGQLKMTSIMRDMIIEIPGHGMQKINAATYYGGPEMMMQVLNTNLGLNITQYAVVNFGNMAKIIDIVGGVYVDITEPEMNQINTYMGDIAQYTDITKAEFLAHKDEWKLKSFGKKKLLTGIQAVTYARIRHIDSDYQRTQRQRNVINGIMAQVRNANLVQLMQVGTEAIKLVKTNVSITTAVGYAWSVLGCKLEKDKVKEWRIPSGELGKSKNGPQGQGIYDMDYVEQAARVHKYIYEA